MGAAQDIGNISLLLFVIAESGWAGEGDYPRTPLKIDLIDYQYPIMLYS
jgi:hypothetical protein